MASVGQGKGNMGAKVPFGLGDVSIVWRSFMLLIS